MFLREIKATINGGSYPDTVAAVSDIAKLRFDTPVTLISGENGSGKTTVMEILAGAVGARRIGDPAQGKASKMNALQKAVSRFTPVMNARPSTAYFFQAEDFIRYIDRLKNDENEALSALQEIEVEYAERGSYAKSLARMPHCRTLAEIRGMFDPPLHRVSHGEGFLEFFGASLRPGGLYLLDEPEAALSYPNQYVLMNMISDAVKSGSQLIISTHSPVLLAYPQAENYLLSKDGVHQTNYAEIENVRFLKSFLNDTKAYVDRLSVNEEK